jgi:hypothetical protein
VDYWQSVVNYEAVQAAAATAKAEAAAEAQQQMQARADLEQAAGEILRETEGDEKLLSVAEDEELQKFNELYEAYTETNDRLGEAQERLEKAKLTKDQKTIEAAKKKTAAAEKAAVKAFKPLEDFYKQLTEKYDLHSEERQVDAVQEEVKEDLPEDLPEDNIKQEEQPQQTAGSDEQIAHLEEIKNYPGADKKLVQAEIDRLQAEQGIAQAEQSPNVQQAAGAEDENKPEITFLDPRTMSNEEKEQRGEKLHNAAAIDVAEGQIVATDELSAREAAEKWWGENVPEPVLYDTEAGEVEINKTSVKDSLAHGYGQAKLDAITALANGFKNAVHIGTLPDSARQEGVNNHYFAFPINYKGKRCYVFCRAMQDANKNRLYVHEVFVADNIKKGNTLQTAAFQPHGGIALYRDILANVLNGSEQSALRNQPNAGQVEGEQEPSSEGKDTNISETSNNQEVKSSENIEAERHIQEPAPKFQAGDKVMYKGKEMEVVRAHGDKLDLKYDPTGVLPIISVGIDASEVEAVSREADKETAEEAEKPQEQAKEEAATDAEQRENKAEAQREKAPLGTIRAGKHTKTGEALWIVTPTDRVSKEEFAKLKASAKGHGGYYSSFKPNNGFLFKSEEDAQAFNEENARESDEPISHEELSSVVGGTFDTITPEVKEESRQDEKAAEQEKEPGARWEYHIYVNEDSGLCSISRDDVSGPVPIGDSRFRITADNPVAQLSGSQYAQLKSQAERELRKYQNKQKQYQQDQIYIENQLKGNKAREEQDKRYIEDYKASVKRAGDVFAGGKVKTVTVGGVRCKTDEEIKAAIAEKINKQVSIARESARTSWGWDPKDLHYNLEFDGVKVNVKVTVSRREASYLNGDTKPSSQVAISYTCPELFGNSIFHAQPKDGIMGIVDRFRNDFATGKYQQAAIAGFEADIERMASDNALMLQRRGVPFAETDKLAEAKAKVAEYTARMKEEMAEKEKKYAEAQAAETDLDVNSIDIEDEETGKDAQFQATDEELGIGDDAQQLAFDTVTEMLSNAGIPVEQLSDEAMRQMAERSDAQLQAKLSSLAKAANTIRGWLANNKRGKSFTIELPERSLRLVRNEMGRDFDSHTITANGIAHAKKNHGENGKKLTEKSIPLRDEDFALAPYIMTCPTYVKKGTTKNGRDSVRFYKTLENGHVVVVEKEWDNSADDLETINMWAELSDVSNAKKALNRTSETPTISRSDIANIVKDAEDTITFESKSQLMTAYHGSGAKFDAFDSSHMGEGEGGQAYGWGHYVTEVEGIGRTYAEARKKGTRFSIYKGKGLQELYVREPKTAEEAKSWAAWGVLRDMEQGASFEESVGRNRRYLTETIEQIEKFLEENQWLEEHDKAERRRTIEMYRSAIEALNTFREEDFSTPSAVLYTVDIPDDNGTNYLDWGKTLPKAQRKQIADHLRTLNDSELTREQHGSNWLKEGWNTLANTIEREQYAAKEIVEKLRDAVGSPRRVSEILSESGFVGIKIPTRWQTRGFQDGTYNYTVFKDSDLEIKNRIQFLRDGDVVYGAAVGGKIYLNAERLNPNTPIHEYTHLWDKACKAKNPELWKRGIELMKQTSLWEEVKRDPNYEGLNEEGIASEVHSRLTGEHGAELLERLSREAMETSGGVFEKAGKVSVIAELKHWLSSFWHWVKDTMTPWSREEAGRVSLEDFINMPLADLAKGARVADVIAKHAAGGEVRFRSTEGESEEEAIIERAKADGTYMKAPNGKKSNLNERQWVQVRTKAFKKWFGDWEAKEFLLSDRYVSRLKGTEFAKDGVKLTDKVPAFYEKEYGGRIAREGLGEVILDEQSVRDSISHGVGKVKSVGFAAVPEVIRKGIVIDEQKRWKDRKYDSATIAAPISIGDKGYVAVVIVRRYEDATNGRFYLHEVVIQENLHDESIKTDNKAGSHNGDIAKVLKNILNASKVVDENGEPKVVLHLSGKEFTVFGEGINTNT